MILKQCFLTRNSCYTANKKMTNGKPTGIVVHSTGANNPNLQRYVQPLATDAKYKEIIDDIGVNRYRTDWNHTKEEMGTAVCVHAFIGKNAKGLIETYQTLPFDVCCWGSSSGPNGSYNTNPTARVQFEICEDNLSDESYFNKAFTEAIEFCVYLCKTYNLTANDICSHREAHLQGRGSNHADPDHWLKKFNKDMNWFRAEVSKQLAKTTVTQPTTTATTTTTNDYKIGSVVKFVGTKHYTSSYKSGIAKTCKPCKVKITNIVKKSVLQPHSVLVQCIDGTYNGANGWVSPDDIVVENIVTPVTSKPTTPTPVTSKIVVGDAVKCKATATRYSNGTFMPKFVLEATLYVRAIEQDGKVYLVSTEKVKNVYTGRIKATDVEKI